MNATGPEKQSLSRVPLIAAFYIVAVAIVPGLRDCFYLAPHPAQLAFLWSAVAIGIYFSVRTFSELRAGNLVDSAGYFVLILVSLFIVASYAPQLMK